MTANRELVRQRNIPEEDVEVIDMIHDHLEYYLTLAFKWSCDHGREILTDHFTEMEYLLQDLWRFDKDDRYHTWTPRLHARFREVDYAGATFICMDSFEQRTITDSDLRWGGLVSIGKGFIDFGGVVRIVGNIQRLH